MELEISGISNLGHGIAFDEEGNKIFIPKTVTNDIIEAENVKKSNKFTLGKIVNIIEASEYRRKPECKYFDDCGGCTLQHLKDNFYQEFKQNNILHTLIKSGFEYKEKIEFIAIGSHSRRRVNFHVNQKNDLGFFKENSNDLVKIDDCLVLNKEIAVLIPKLQNLLRTIPSNIIKDISICAFDNLVDVVFKLREGSKPKEMKAVLAEFSNREKINVSYRKGTEITALHSNLLPQLNLGEVTINVPSEAFIQATKKGQDAIITKIIEVINNKPINNVIDLYCGIGTYSFAISHLKNITKITAIEGEEFMVDNVNQNSRENNLEKKIQAKNRDLVRDPLKTHELNNYDLAIVNPPRNGARSQIKHLVNSEIENIIMVSCNLNSFIQDSKILVQNGFKLNSVTVIDQFYYTAHIEIVAIFTRYTI